VAERRIPEAGAAAKAATAATLRKANLFQVSFDGGKHRYCEDSTKMIGVCANLPKGGSVYMGTINTKDETLDAERCGAAACARARACGLRAGCMRAVGAFVVVGSLTTALFNY
jgi:hypothetical protein